MGGTPYVQTYRYDHDHDKLLFYKNLSALSVHSVVIQYYNYNQIDFTSLCASSRLYFVTYFVTYFPVATIVAMFIRGYIYFGVMVTLMSRRME